MIGNGTRDLPACTQNQRHFINT